MIRANRFLPALGGAIAGGAIALIVASGGGTTTHSTTTEVVASSRSAALPASFTGTGLSVNQIYRNTAPGVVDITVSSQSATDPFGNAQQTRGEGSGVVFDSSGNILTDEHVVSGASSVTVKFQDGRTATANVVGSDPSTDVAVIHVNVPSSELHPIPFADSSTAQVGDGVVAMGSPFGLPETTTTGIVSATGRSIQAPNQYTITGAIQTDAAINPGNSGGPLLNSSGQVLGLNDQIQTQSGSSAGVGFAVPSNTAARVARQIISSGGGTVKHAYLGVQLSANGSGGATIGSVTPGAPADGAGLKPGDVITAVNGKATRTTDQFISTIDTYSPGDTVTLTVNHGGSTHGVKVKLGNRPSSPTSTLG
jgi:putative serine protease PepD